MKKASLLLLLNLITLSAIAQVYSPNVGEDQVAIVPDERIVFLGHAIKFWDGNNIGDVVREGVRLAKLTKTTIVATTAKVILDDPRLVGGHYYQPEDPNYLVMSEAGQHSLEFPNLKQVIFYGGNLGKCLCEGIRDVVRTWSKYPSNRTLDMYIVIDGTYDGHPPFNGMREEEVEGYFERFLAPSFNCPINNWRDKPRLALKKTALFLTYNGKFKKTLWAENDQTVLSNTYFRRINVQFISSSMVPGVLDKRLSGFSSVLRQFPRIPLLDQSYRS